MTTPCGNWLDEGEDDGSLDREDHEEDAEEENVDDGENGDSDGYPSEDSGDEAADSDSPDEREAPPPPRKVKNVRNSVSSSASQQQQDNNNTSSFISSLMDSAAPIANKAASTKAGMKKNSASKNNNNKYIASSAVSQEQQINNSFADGESTVNAKIHPVAKTAFLSFRLSGSLEDFAKGKAEVSLQQIASSVSSPGSGKRSSSYGALNNLMSNSQKNIEGKHQNHKEKHGHKNKHEHLLSPDRTYASMHISKEALEKLSLHDLPRVNESAAPKPENPKVLIKEVSLYEINNNNFKVQLAMNIEGVNGTLRDHTTASGAYCQAVIGASYKGKVDEVLVSKDEVDIRHSIDFLSKHPGYSKEKARSMLTNITSNASVKGVPEHNPIVSLIKRWEEKRDDGVRMKPNSHGEYEVETELIDTALNIIDNIYDTINASSLSDIKLSFSRANFSIENSNTPNISRWIDQAEIKDLVTASPPDQAIRSLIQSKNVLEGVLKVVYYPSTY